MRLECVNESAVVYLDLSSARMSLARRATAPKEDLVEAPGRSGGPGSGTLQPRASNPSRRRTAARQLERPLSVVRGRDGRFEGDEGAAQVPKISPSEQEALAISASPARTQRRHR